MKRSSMVAGFVVAAAMGAFVSPVYADSAQATCEVRKDGDTRKGASGPCTFSQRQGYIDLDLRNGDSYSLTPGGKEGHYHDQKGNKVVRRLTGGGTEEFKWEGGKKIILTFAGSAGSAAPAPASSAAVSGKPDSFDTVCGVIVDGKNYRYRCGATDFYSGGQKVRTELRYPDQTITLTWRPGNRVGLQFEGMVPKEARYATAEGETNFVFEGKTYFYYSDKGLARMEFQNFRD
jgi:hypothetical protein